MRKIKFRGQTVDTKELIYGDLIQTEKDFKNVVEILDWSKVGCKPEKSLVVNPETVGQFTGLKDKKGIEIYEGDIVYIEGYGISKHKTKIIFEESEAKFSTNTIYESDCFEHSSRCIEVIGNMFDNPELL